MPIDVLPPNEPPPEEAEFEKGDDEEDEDEGEPGDEDAEAEPSELSRLLEAFDVTAYPSPAIALGALIDLIPSRHPEDMAILLDLQKLRVELLAFEMQQIADEQQAKRDARRAAEEARDKYGGREPNARVLAPAPKDPEAAMRFIAELMPRFEGPIIQLADDAERAVHPAARASAGLTMARLMTAAASVALAINRIGGESRHRIVYEARGQRQRADEVPDYSHWVRK